MLIRPATESDHATIKRVVRAARINPMDLDWRRFLIAQDADAGNIIGVGQIKAHNDGSCELASIAVIPEKQKQGIGSAIVRALMAKESPPLFLFCQAKLEMYYTRFGFRKIGVEEMTTYYKRMWRLVNAMPEFIRANVHVIVMKWDG
ncbi:MAG: GNAT family N-acetyltransferase [Chloroflexi bacterium]|nr:GNAT family N-acetyltransferase [Chloroflexota bacterium]